MSRNADTVLAEHWLMYPLGAETPPGRRGKSVPLDQPERVRELHAHAVAAGHAPTVTLYRKSVSPCSRTPQSHETPAHLDRVGTDLTGPRRCLVGRPLAWPTYLSVRVTLGGGRLHAAGTRDASGVVERVSAYVGYAQPHADVNVEVAGREPHCRAPRPRADGPMHHTYVVVRADGTTGTEADDDVREVVGGALDEALRRVEDDLRRLTEADPAPR